MNRLQDLHEKHVLTLGAILIACQETVVKRSAELTQTEELHAKYHLGIATRHFKNMKFIQKWMRLPVFPYLLGPVFRRESDKARRAAAIAELVVLNKLASKP